MKLVSETDKSVFLAACESILATASLTSHFSLSKHLIDRMSERGVEVDELLHVLSQLRNRACEILYEIVRNDGVFYVESHGKFTWVFRQVATQDDSVHVKIKTVYKKEGREHV